MRKLPAGIWGKCTWGGWARGFGTVSVYVRVQERAGETRVEESFDPIPRTPESSEDEGDGEENQGLNVNKEEEHIEKEEEDKLYRDVNINQGRARSSSVSSQFVTDMLNPTSDAGMDSIFTTASTSMAPLLITTPTMTPSTVTTITTTSQAPIPPTPIPSEVLQNLPTFASVFRFDDRLRSLEQNFSEVMQTNQFAGTVFAILGIVQHFIDQRMNEAVQVAVQLQSDRLREEAQKENDEFLKTAVNEQLEAKVLTRSPHSSRTSYAVVADLSEMKLKKILIEKMEGNKSIQRSDAQRNLYKALIDAYESDKIILDTYGEIVTLKRRRDDDENKDEEPSARPDQGSKRRREGKEPESASTPLKPATRSAGRTTTGSKSRQASASESAFIEEPVQTTSQMEEPSHLEFETGVEDQPIVQSSQHPEWFSQPKKWPTLDRDWNKTLPALYGSIQSWISKLAKQADTRSSFNELMDTPLNFSNFIMNRLRVDTLTPELLAGPTYDLVKGSCKSLIELEYHLEEVYKATTDQLDWVNPKGQQYPHNLLQPLPLIPDNRGRRVIPFAHFINNDLEYLRGGASSRKYTTSVTKTKVADYGHIKWIEDLVPRTIYKHLDWITIRRDDDKLYNFKEGNLKRLRLQDIKDMLLILVQGKLSNLTVEERFAFNVSLRMFTRSIVIQRRLEDLQLGVESYQKRLNLTKPDMYRSDLKRREAYTAFSYPRGFIYQNKDKKNRLMRIDELHKFNDGTLNDVRTALDDRLKGIRMRYLPQTIWRKSDKDRAAAMIQAIDKMLKTKRVMSSLERFVGGRLYEGDFRMLQRTNQKAFIGGYWSDSGEEDDEKVKDKICLMAQALNEICLGVDLEPDEWIKDSGCSKHMTGNQKLFSTYKVYNGGNVIFGSNLRGNIIGKVSMTRCLELLHMNLFDPSVVRSYGGNRYTLVIVDDYSRKIEESLNVTFDETPLPSKTSPLVDDDLDEEEAIKVTKKKNLENDIKDETLEIDEIVNFKESRNHPLKNVIGNLNQRTLRSQSYNQSNFFHFISTIEPKNVNKALTDERLIVAMQEELKQFIANDVWELVLQPRNMTIKGTKWVF
nr:retrovirus-related Pol polyprotein from transposon TNT 1-94 [Tanacetum cinerariifolium]